MADEFLDNLLDRQQKPLRPPRRGFRIRTWQVILLIVALAGIAGAVYYLLVPLDAPIPDDAGQLVAGLEQATTTEGYPRLGNPDAPILIEDFSSYACPHCADFHEEIFPDLVDKIAAGQVQFVFIPVSHIGSGAGDAAQAALCAGEQGRFWTMHDVLFSWNKPSVGSLYGERRLKKGAENLGLDTDAFAACLDGDRDVLEAARREFTLRGLQGTPAFFINGQRVRDYDEFEDLG